MPLTPKQKEILTFVQKYSTKHDFAPSLEEIKKHFKLRSVSTIHQHLAAIENKGYLQKRKNQHRSIVTQTTDRLIQIPLLGTIAAGQPIEAIENRETIAVSQSKLPFVGGDYYALRVSGQSMVEENINDGDIVLVKKQSTAQNGDKVVALIDNSEATLKQFYKEKDHIRLQPANKSMKPIIVGRDTPLTIQGVVVNIIQEAHVSMPIRKLVSPFAPKREQILPLNQIICGDAVEELRKLPSESCDVVIIDPPYNIGKDFGNNNDTRELGEYVRWAKSWIAETIRVMKPTATMFIYGFSEILAYLSVEIPLQKRWLIWHYTNKNVASFHFWQRSHESIICAWKGKPIFNRDDVREPYTEGFLNGAAGKTRAGTVGRFSKGGKETTYVAHEGGALPRDVIKVPALAGGAGMVERWFFCKTCDKVCQPRELKKHQTHDVLKHPTQKPLDLSKRLIKSASPKGDGVVLVPFVGSGSECVAAKELGKNYLGFEINPEYVTLAKKWLAFS